jgi:hypothetical protein
MRMFKRKKGKTDIKFVPNQDFLDEGFRYLKGEVYSADINRVRYFEYNGWLEGSIAAPPPAVTLDVDNSILGTKDSNG